ncbi:protein E6 [Cynara cardunculus var. scolymus]|uniref:protein E6 n=1 Tax=Cynara cardunculus var. scolymus TaxID=59895 RepID=UPI000D629EAA|nr:protein E6 [Cynara cardunculus var. scolymus]
MTTTTTSISLFFLLFAPISLQLHARETQFFSKFSNHIPIQDELLPTTIQPQQQDQNFIPQTTDSTGYGLYGHLPPSTTAPATTDRGAYHNTVAYSKDSFDTSTDAQYAIAGRNQFNGDRSMYMNHEKQDKFYGHLDPSLTTTPAATNGGAYDNLPTTLPENYNTVAYTTPIHSENSYETTATEYDNKEYQYNGDSRMYNSKKQGSGDTRVLDYGKYNHVSDMYNTEKQGMSDTRYMDKGKYYYDLSSESSNPRVFGSRNGYKYNNRGYYGNDDNSYHRYNSNARFQENQEDVFTP